MTDSSAPRRGRPPATSTGEVARTALQLFVEQGYEATTLEQVAVAVGITRRSLFRYFDSKSAIVWHGEDDARRAAERELAAVPDDVPWRTGVARAALAALRFPDDDLAALRLRLRLVSTVPVLRSHLAGSAAAAGDAIAVYVAARTGAGAGDLEPRVLARAALAASTTGLVWWAESADADGDPRAAVRTALAAVGFPA